MPSDLRPLDVRGDELHFDGQVVALLVNGGREDSHMGTFLDWVRDNPDLEVGTPDKCECKHKADCHMHRAEVGTAPDDDAPTDYDTALDDVGKAAEEYAKGGLLRMSDLAIVLRKLKEGTE